MTTPINRLMSACSVTMVPRIASSSRVPVAQEDIVQPGRHHTFSIHEVADGLQHSLGVWQGCGRGVAGV